MKGFELNYGKAMKRFEKLVDKSISSLSDFEENMKKSYKTLINYGRRQAAG